MPVLDTVHHFRGLHGGAGTCRIRVYRPIGFPPVVLATELPDNPGTSITNLAEQLAAEVLERYLPDRLGEDRPLVWIEHYPPRRPLVQDETYDLVTFAHYQPRQVLRLGQWRPSFGSPDWRRLSREQVELLIDEPLPPEEEQASR